MRICWDNLEKLIFNRNTCKWYDKFQNPYDIRICSVCKEYYLGNGNQNHCSKKCSIKGIPKSEETKRKMSESGKKKVFSELHKQNLTLGQKKRYIKEEEREKTRISLIGRKPSEKCIEVNRRRMLNGGASILRSFKTKEGYKRAAEKQSKYMLSGGAAHANSFITNPSKPQKRIFDLVKEEFQNAKINFPYLNYSLDVAIPEYKISIEYDCWYWHKNKEKDLIRQRRLEQEGWKFIRFKDRIPEKDELIMEINKWII